MEVYDLQTLWRDLTVIETTSTLFVHLLLKIKGKILWCVIFQIRRWFSIWKGCHCLSVANKWKCATQTLTSRYQCNVNIENVPCLHLSSAANLYPWFSKCKITIKFTLTLVFCPSYICCCIHWPHRTSVPSDFFTWWWYTI